MEYSQVVTRTVFIFILLPFALLLYVYVHIAYHKKGKVLHITRISYTAFVSVNVQHSGLWCVIVVRLITHNKERLLFVNVY